MPAFNILDYLTFLSLFPVEPCTYHVSSRTHVIDKKILRRLPTNDDRSFEITVEGTTAFHLQQLQQSSMSSTRIPVISMCHTTIDRISH